MINKKRTIASVLKIIIFLAAIAFCIFLVVKYGGSSDEPGDQTISTEPSVNSAEEAYPSPDITLSSVNSGDISMDYRCGNGYFYKNNGGSWEFVYLKGVNMGLTLPDTSLSNPDIPYNTYIDWFEKISEMNANTIKVFTVMNPDFYNALYDFNKDREEPLMLLHGIWISEDDMYNIGDVFGENGLIVDNFKRAVRETIDIMHGRSDYTSYGKIEKAVYDKDISEYVAGYILGLEWPSDFVIATNENNSQNNSYHGDFLYTENASPFEAFLCETGDALIKYENDTYNYQTPVAFLNWSTTDPIEHTNEPFEEEDAVSVDTRNIKSSDKYYAGQFAAYDIYPYYPEFLNHQPEYIFYKDAEGKINPYRAYLNDLKKLYDVPIIVAEFGVPTSRGIAHTSLMGYDQGGITEEQQGKYNASMMKDIAKAGFAGSMMFSWQDEWFKQTWNTVKYSPADASKRTPNRQSAEQSYGILAYEPSENAICYVDGNFSEWIGSNPVAESGDLKLYAKVDEGYLYLMVKQARSFFDSGKFYIPIGFTGKGNMSSSDYGLDFSSGADFLLVMDGVESTRLLVDSAYDSYNFKYDKEAYKGTFNSGDFNTVRQFISNEIVLPLSGKTLPPVGYEAGILLFGNSNPDSEAYNSIADFYYSGDAAEIRISWALLNIVNAAEKKCIDFFSDKIAFTLFDDISLGICSSEKTSVQMNGMSFGGFNYVTYHPRLKESYIYIKDAMKSLMD